MQHNFKFSLEQPVVITESGEDGKVIAMATYAHAEDSYRIRYKAADGRAVEAWWDESALVGLN